MANVGDLIVMAAGKGLIKKFTLFSQKGYTLKICLQFYDDALKQDLTARYNGTAAHCCRKFQIKLFSDIFFKEMFSLKKILTIFFIFYFFWL